MIVRERLTLVMIGVEQRLVRLAAQHGGDLPGEIMDVLHAGVEAEAAGRRHFMRGVTGEKDVADAIAVGNDRGGFPGAHAEHG